MNVVDGSSASSRSSEIQLQNVNFPIIQINGRKVLGPPSNWDGPPPSNACEIFVRRLPRYLSAEALLQQLQRFGNIYEFRLMMDFHCGNRGYAFVRYTSPDEAKIAMEILQHLYIAPGKTPQVERSFDKSRLFVGNIPKHLRDDDIETGFRELFPNLKKVIILKRISDGNYNRGFVFIDFHNHEEALEVKKLVTPGSIRMWGQILKIVWANPERLEDEDVLEQTKTVFVRNVDPSVTNKNLYDILTPIVTRSEVLKLSRVREFAFISFATRSAAELVMDSLQGVEVEGHALHFEWAHPATAGSVHVLKNCDFDGMLRIKCIANNWSIPVVMFGRLFISEEVQCAAIMIRSNYQVHAFFFEIHTSNLSDIQSRLCEVVVNLIRKSGGLPIPNYVVKVIDDEAYIVGVISLGNGTFASAHSIQKDLRIYGEELLAFCDAIIYLSLFTTESIFAACGRALRSNRGFLTGMPLANGRILACLDPRYRQRPPLKYNIDNRQIVLVLCDAYTLTNFTSHNLPVAWELRGASIFDPSVIYTVLNLMPSHLAQPNTVQHIVNAVKYGELPGYHRN